MNSNSDPVIACGVVVARSAMNSSGEVAVDPKEVAVLIVHRNRYDDWSFPKGKLDEGETLEQCALRELLEETSVVVELQTPLPTALYVDHMGRDKEVHYWLSNILDASTTLNESDFVANDEVDSIKWVALSEAKSILTYEIDHGLVDEVALELSK